MNHIADHLWQSTLFAGVVWLLTLALRKNHARVRHGLWLAASCKFLVPFSLLIALGGQVHWRTAPANVAAGITVVMEQASQPFTATAAEASVPTSSRLPAILLGIWVCGVIGITCAWWVRWRRIKAAVRAGSPLNLDVPIQAVSSPTLLEPGIFGVFRPALLLPEGIFDRLTPAQLQAVIAHELCHVRHRDNLIATLHMLVETVFWFHPLVWWIGKRMIEERERACDEDVLRSLGEPKTYAEGILNVCKLYVESPLTCVSGISGSNLKKRIEAIMAHRIVRNLDFGRKVLLATAGLAAVIAPIVIGITDALPLRGQSQGGARLAFEVASVKLNSSTDRRGMGIQILPGGRFVASAPVFVLAAIAYDVPLQSDRMTGGPDWLRTERYDIEATPDKDAFPASISAKDRNDKVHSMLQTLLAERFKIVIHRDIKELPVYALTVKDSRKLQKAAVEEKDCLEVTKSPQDPASCHTFSGGQGQGIHAQAVSLPDLASYASSWADRPVIDKSGLLGLFNIQTEGWAPMRPRPPRPPGQEPTAEDLAFADPARPTLFQIFDRLGLKLESQKAPVEMFVIESAERPSEN